MAEFLLELYSEEIPPQLQIEARSQLKQFIENSFKENHLKHKDLTVYSSPTRLTLFAKNLSDEPIVGTATFNVTPAKAGQYFMKIDCFCFVEQLLKPDESMNMPVTFFIDPDIYKDENVKEVNEITLSYTFMKSMDQSLIDGNKL